MFITFQGKLGFFFFAEVGDNKTSEPDNEKECERNEEKEEITLSKVPSIRNSTKNNEFYHQEPPAVFSSIIF